MSIQTNVSVEEPAQGITDVLPTGTALCGGQYTVKSFINSGGFGVTYLALDSLNRHVVIKECYPNAMCCRAGRTVRLRSHNLETDFSQVVEQFQKEARALARLQHPNIVGVHQIFEDNGTAYIALDLVSGRDLFDIMDQHSDYLTPQVIQSIVQVLLEALEYVHENGILHRDISPDNILIDPSGAPVLIDFGASRQGVPPSSRILTRVHSVKDGYSPQEFYFDGTAQSQSSDLYALAATVVHLITRAPPPNSSTRLSSITEGKADPYVPLRGRFPDFDPGFLSCVDTCMALFAKDRIQTAREWRDAISGKGAIEVTPALGDSDFEKTIAELVQSNRRALAEDAARTVAETPEPVDEVDEIEAARLAAEHEYWAILKEDPRKLARKTRKRTQPAPRETTRARRSFASLLGWAKGPHGASEGGL